MKVPPIYDYAILLKIFIYKFDLLDMLCQVFFCFFQILLKVVPCEEVVVTFQTVPLCSA